MAVTTLHIRNQTTAEFYKGLDIKDQDGLTTVQANMPVLKVWCFSLIKIPETGNLEPKPATEIMFIHSGTGLEVLG